MAIASAQTVTDASKALERITAGPKTDEEREETLQKTVPPEEKVQKIGEEHSFNFSYKSGSREYSGSFKTKILTVRERQAMGLLRAQYAGGIAYEQLDPFTQELNLILAHLGMCLVERPDWAEDLQGLDDENILYKIYEEVVAHEAIFRGRPETQTQSKGESE